MAAAPRIAGPRAAAGEPRIGLVLGAGGVVGTAWLIGALIALVEETGWCAHDAEVIPGTSAGSVVGSLYADGIDPRVMADIAMRAPVAGSDLLADLASPAAGPCMGTQLALALAAPPIGPGSWRLGLSTLRHPGTHTRATLLGGWLPRGIFDTKPISRVIDRFVSGTWPAHDNFWAAACDYRSGGGIVFGRAGAPATATGSAVAASCAVPGFHHPVTIGGRRYVDGGLRSLSNLDALQDADLDLVVYLNPMPSGAGTPARGIVDRAMRILCAGQLDRELAALRSQATDVVVVEPTADDLGAMGGNPMSRSRTRPVIDQAVVSTALSLQALRQSGRTLPAPRRVVPARDDWPAHAVSLAA